MLRALLESGFRPSLVVGTSVGALNGAAIAADPTLRSVAVLADLWGSLAKAGMFTDNVLARAGTLAKSRTHFYSPAPLRKLVATHLPATFGDLALEFQCVAASI
jgi:NTE family protein